MRKIDQLCQIEPAKFYPKKLGGKKRGSVIMFINDDIDSSRKIAKTKANAMRLGRKKNHQTTANGVLNTYAKSYASINPYITASNDT